MSAMELTLRRSFGQVEDIHLVAGRSDDGGVLRKVVVAAVIANPYAGRGYVDDLSGLIEASGAIGTMLGQRAVALLDAPVASYGKAGIVGTDGEQEHANAALTSVFGNALRDAIGGGEAWISSVTKTGAPGVSLDIPLAFKDEIWVRDHYDAVEVHIPDAPRPDEIVVAAAVTNRGRINPRVGGMTVSESKSA